MIPEIPYLRFLGLLEHQLVLQKRPSVTLTLTFWSLIFQVIAIDKYRTAFTTYEFCRHFWTELSLWYNTWKVKLIWNAYWRRFLSIGSLFCTIVCTTMKRWIREKYSKIDNYKHEVNRMPWEKSISNKSFNLKLIKAWISCGNHWRWGEGGIIFMKNKLG